MEITRDGKVIGSMLLEDGDEITILNDDGTIAFERLVVKGPEGWLLIEKEEKG